MFIILTDWLQRIILKKTITTATLHFAYLCDTDAENKTAHWNVTVRHNICITWTLAINISTPNLIVTQLLTTPTPLTILHVKKWTGIWPTTSAANVACHCSTSCAYRMKVSHKYLPMQSAWNPYMSTSWTVILILDTCISVLQAEDLHGPVAIRNGAVELNHFLLVVCSNEFSILHHFQNITTFSAQHWRQHRSLHRSDSRTSKRVEFWSPFALPYL